MPLALARADRPLTLDALVEEPARVHELPAGDCAAVAIRLAALLVAVSARVAELAQPAPALQPPLDVKTAAPLLGLSADSLSRRAKSDPAYRALVFDNGTDRLLFDAAKIEQFRRRRTG